MHALRAANESHGGDAVAEMLERVVRGLEHGRVVREPEVVVRAQIDQFAAVRQADHGTLRGADHALALEQARGFQVGRFPAQAFAKLTDHFGYLWSGLGGN